MDARYPSMHYAAIDQWNPIDVREFRATWPVSQLAVSKGKTLREDMLNLKFRVVMAILNIGIQKSSF